MTLQTDIQALKDAGAECAAVEEYGDWYENVSDPAKWSHPVHPTEGEKVAQAAIHELVEAVKVWRWVAQRSINEDGVITTRILEAEALESCYREAHHE